ncbi:hypothetical protein VP01_3787g2 [Puccinia sorghi]|uniref:Tet-like 2OG-Fe(II) oxygenase domain-containing protein n=1 Tax=Puccinia sorghi TaxID=27349 RepID=A0A0L6UTK5_9BASI|nr:hypothetical protein VP01_3787g2 [Puccinia sorghi]
MFENATLTVRDGFFSLQKKPNSHEKIQHSLFLILVISRSAQSFILLTPSYLHYQWLLQPPSTTGPLLPLILATMLSHFFPDHKLGIKFDHQHGIVKMVWKSNKYKNCTLPYPSPSSTFTRLGMSLQINFSLADLVTRRSRDLVVITSTICLPAWEKVLLLSFPFTFFSCN